MTELVCGRALTAENRALSLQRLAILVVVVARYAYMKTEDNREACVQQISVMSQGHHSLSILNLNLRRLINPFDRIMLLSLIQLMLFMSSLVALWSAEFLMPGLHKHQGGDKVGQLTLSVPPAISEGKPLPVLFILSEKGQPAVEP